MMGARTDDDVGSLPTLIEDDTPACTLGTRPRALRHPAGATA